MSPIIGATIVLSIVPQTDDFLQEVQCEKLEMNQGVGGGRGLQFILWDYHDTLGYSISWWLWGTGAPNARRFSPIKNGKSAHGLIWAEDGVLRVIRAQRVEYTHTEGDPEITEQQFDGQSSGSRSLWGDWPER
ncbi:uncharacterized protein METZ01_LOCUS84461 [marine metagenome]|jgi:hypothetical protein|uniref:Uncharacterized protein n=1 Tax=marine metagenome TaxID=408172 RepID=A0A381UW77_9ZZZZ